ncbi:UNVERIFIED_CONTAM: hypothetical protein FKN15_063902 [Acipenser sinensis]
MIDFYFPDPRSLKQSTSNGESSTGMPASAQLCTETLTPAGDTGNCTVKPIENQIVGGKKWGKVSVSSQAVQAENVTVTEGGQAEINCKLQSYDGSIVVIQNPHRQTLFFNGTRGEQPRETHVLTGARARVGVTETRPGQADQCLGSSAFISVIETRRDRVKQTSVWALVPSSV